MTIQDLIWYGVLGSMTIAYVMALLGVRAAKQHHVLHHSHWMIASCTLVGLWLIGYVTKQLLFGRDQFGGTSAQYWTFYVPVLVIHTILAVTTICLGVMNLYSGLTKLRHGTGVGAMVCGAVRHRALGRILVGTFSGTILTAYIVYLMLFQWFPET